MYEAFEQQRTRYLASQDSLALLQGLQAAVQAGKAVTLIVADTVGSVPVPQAAALNAITNAIAGITSQATALKAKLDAAIAAVQ